MSTLLQHSVAAQAEATPDAVAIVFEGASMTYGELEQASNRLARLLAAAGCAPGDRVAILMPKQPAAIVAMLGVLKLGAAYVPLDPRDPPVRLSATLRAADCRCVLAAAPVGPTLHEALTAARLDRQPLVGWLDEPIEPEIERMAAFTQRHLAAFPATTPAAANDDNSIAHILFTSGSTGAPKGVMITHDGVVQFLTWARRYFGICSSDRLSQHAPLRFDLSTFDVFAALCSGAELHLVPPELNLQPYQLAQFIRRSRITQWLSVPSILNLMANFDVVGQDDFPELRRVLFAGEVLPAPTLIHWMSRLPHVRFTNLYGPTETTIASSYYTVPRCPLDGQQHIPIGTACDGEELLVLDDQLRPVPDGEIGDLYIRGVGLSPGYWRDPDKTRSAFLSCEDGAGAASRMYRTGDRVRREADGLHYFIGRTDMQIKSRGYRIELGAIEAALHSLPGLREGAIVAIPSTGFEGTLICCAYAPGAGVAISPISLSAALAGLLPGYMLPVRWRSYDALPRNGNGKCDRLRLQEDFGLAEMADQRQRRPGRPNAGIGAQNE